jgi:hypothetical protein
MSIIGIVVLAVAALTVYGVYEMSFGPPVAILQNPEDLLTVNVLMDDEDVTESIDREALVSLLLRYNCRKVPYKYYREPMADRKAEITLVLGNMDKTSFLSLFFGSINVCTETGQPRKEIIDGDKLLEELQTLIG